MGWTIRQPGLPDKGGTLGPNIAEGYAQFKIGATLRKVREAAGLCQEELTNRLKTRKTAIYRIENHAEDIKLSTLEKVAAAPTV